MWRLGGVTSIERAVALLNRLHLYQDSALWIIGGSHTDNLFQYTWIRERIEATIANSQSASSDIRIFYLAAMSLLADILALYFIEVRRRLVTVVRGRLSERIGGAQWR